MHLSFKLFEIFFKNKFVAAPLHTYFQFQGGLFYIFKVTLFRICFWSIWSIPSLVHFYKYDISAIQKAKKNK